MQSLDGGNYESKTHQDQGPNFCLLLKMGGGGVNSLHHEGILCWEKLANANKTEQGKETNLLQKNAVSESEASRLCENLKEDKERKQNCITL